MLSVAFFSWAETTHAGTVTLPYSTSFDGCSQDVNYSVSGWACGTSASTVYNNVSAGACTGSGYEQISSAANYSGGAGGRGWRRYVCSGSNSSTGSLSFNMPSSRDYWIRWYTRWEQGFSWSSLSYQKVIYFRPGTGVVFGLLGPDALRLTPQGGHGINHGAGSANIYSATDGSLTCSDCGWNAQNPSGTMGANGIRQGDNSWHAVEVHFKNQSGTGTYDGEFDCWIDGTLKWHVDGINWESGYTDFASIQIMSNQSDPSLASPMYNDVDDIAVSNTGYIGPLTGGSPADTTPPSAPSGLSVT